MVHYPVRSLLNQNLLRFYSGFQNFYILKLRHLKPHTESPHDCSCLTCLDLDHYSTLGVVGQKSLDYV